MARKPSKSKLTAEIEAAKVRYADFLCANPTAMIDHIGSGPTAKLALVGAWDDPSIALLIPEDDGVLVESLRHVFLPPRYTAIYHADIKRMEVIWTAFKLSEGQSEVKDREFTMRLDGKALNCKFSQSSERLLEIASRSSPLRMSETNFRNLRSFSALSSLNGAVDKSAFDTPLSFWISNLNWDDEKILEAIRHINFYLRHFDAHSPVIEIHPAKSEIEINPRNRYIEDDFPKKIASKKLDQSLLVFYNASFSGNRSANFLNLYRIVEYVSYTHAHDTLRKDVKGILNRPTVVDNLDRSANELIYLLREAKLEKEQDGIIRLIKEIISHSKIWKEICGNKEFFCKATEFDGDLSIGPLISINDTAETFVTHGVEKFAQFATRIRNALAHGKDTKSSKSILPTSRNFELLQPWTHLMAVAAAEVVLYDAAH